MDMIIVDYGDLLRPVRYLKEKRNELESIYEELRGIAAEFEMRLCGQHRRRIGLD